jgi:peptide deformylase
MTLLKIVKAPNPVLATVAKKIEKIDATTKRHIKDMTETLEAAKDPEGVGLAAPQVGLSLQLFIVKQTPDSPVSVYINPVVESFPNVKVAKTKKKAATKLEGCLSVDDIWGVVDRHKKVRLSYLDQQGQHHTKTFSGFLATIVQHEVDHLNGILFTKRVLEQKQKLYKSSKDEKGEVVFEETAL